MKGCLLIAFYSIRSERQFCERLQFDLLFKWFLDLNVIASAFDASTFSKNKKRLLEHDMTQQFFQRVLEEARRRKLLSWEHFTVDGTLLEGWVSMKSVQPKDRYGNGAGPMGKNPDVDFRRERRLNATHASTTDPEPQLARNGLGKEAKLCFMGRVLMENRNGLVMEIAVTRATGTAEREAALQMLYLVPGTHHITVGADKSYGTKDLVRECRDMDITPHVAQKQHSAIDARTTRHYGYRISQRIRKRVEEIFGWVKTVGGDRKLRYKGVAKNGMWATCTATAYNLVRMAKLALVPAPASESQTPVCLAGQIGADQPLRRLPRRVKSPSRPRQSSHFTRPHAIN